MKQPFRVGQTVRIYQPGLDFHGEIAKVDSVVKNILPVIAYGKKKHPEWTIHLIHPDWVCTCDFWPHELRKTGRRERRRWQKFTAYNS